MEKEHRTPRFVGNSPALCKLLTDWVSAQRWLRHKLRVCVCCGWRGKGWPETSGLAHINECCEVHVFSLTSTHTYWSWQPAKELKCKDDSAETKTTEKLCTTKVILGDSGRAKKRSTTTPTNIVETTTRVPYNAPWTHINGMYHGAQHTRVQQKKKKLSDTNTITTSKKFAKRKSSFAEAKSGAEREREEAAVQKMQSFSYSAKVCADTLTICFTSRRFRIFAARAQRTRTQAQS